MLSNLPPGMNVIYLEELVIGTHGEDTNHTKPSTAYCTLIQYLDKFSACLSKTFVTSIRSPTNILLFHWLYLP